MQDIEFGSISLKTATWNMKFNDYINTYEACHKGVSIYIKNNFALIKGGSNDQLQSTIYF